MKVYKGYELMEKAMKGEINIKKQKVNSLSLDYKNCTIDFVLKDSAINVMGLNFELIEEDRIDIDSIEEYQFPAYVHTTSREERLVELINEDRKAIKQLNRELKELKNK